MSTEPLILEVETGVYLQTGAGPELLQVGEVEVNTDLYIRRSELKPEWLTGEFLDYEIVPYENQPGDLIPVSALRPCFRTWNEELSRWELKRGISSDGLWGGMKAGALNT